MKTKATLKIVCAGFLLALWPASIPIAAAQTDRLVIAGDGSTFAYPMYSKWIEEYEKDNPAVRLTYVSNGSGAGIHDVMMGTVDFAGTDGPLNKVQMLNFSTHRNCEVLHFPTALGADVPIYNVPGVSGSINFTPQALAGIFWAGLRNGTTLRLPSPIRTYRCPPMILRLSIGKTEAEPPTCGPTI